MVKSADNKHAVSHLRMSVVYKKRKGYYDLIGDGINNCLQITLQVIVTISGCRGTLV